MASHPQRIVMYGGPTSPYVLRVRLALEEAGAKYEPVYFDLDEKPSWFLENVYPVGEVPVLMYGGTDAPPEEPSPDSLLLPESLVILEFIADLFPNAGLWPADPIKRAKARLFTSIVGSKLPSASGLWINNKDDGGSLLRTLETLQGMLPEEEGFVVGEWSLADAAFVPSLLFVGVWAKIAVGFYVKMDHAERVKGELASPRFARLRKYVDDWKKRPSFKVWDEAHATEKWLKRFGKNL